MEVGEHAVKFKSGFFDCLNAGFHLGVARRVKLTLDFVKLEGSVSVFIKLFKSLFYKALALSWEITTESGHKFFKLNGSVRVAVKNIEKSLIVVLIKSWDLEGIEGLAELVEVEMA